MNRNVNDQLNVGSKIVDVERGLEISQPPNDNGNSAEGRSTGNRSRRRNRAVNGTDQQWKEQMSKKLEELSKGQEAAMVQSRKLFTENEALQKEVERLRYLGRLRATSSGNSATAQQQPTVPLTVPNQTTRTSGDCFQLRSTWTLF